MPEPGKKISRLTLLVCAAFTLRLLVAIGIGLSNPPPPGSDEAEYDQYAWNVATGHGYRGISPDVADTDHLTAYRPPGPSLIWAGLFVVFGHRYDVVRLLYCLLSALVVGLIFDVARRCFCERVAWLAAIAWTVFPSSLYFATQLDSETPTTLFFLWFIRECIRFGESPTVRNAAGAGLLYGVTLLVHGSKIIMMPFLILWCVWQFRDSLRSIARALLIPAVAVLTVAPWTIRNYVVMHHFIPLSTTGGSALLQGNNSIVASDPELFGYNIWDTKIPEYHDALVAPNDEVERDKVAGRLAVAWIKEHPGLWPFLFQAKLRRGFTPFLQPRSPFHFRMATLLGWGPVLLGFLVAFVPTLVKFLRRRHPGWLLHLAILHFALMTVIFFGMARYRYSIEPVCVILAAWTATVAVQWLARRFLPSRAPKASPADTGLTDVRA